MSLVPIPELCVMVDIARQFVAGNVHFSYVETAADRCALWAKVHGAHPAIQALAAEWATLADRVWSKQAPPSQALTLEEFLHRVAEDLGEEPAPAHRAEETRSGGE